MAQEVGGPGLTPIDPENVTNQTLQGYPTEDNNMSTGLGNKLTNILHFLFTSSLFPST